MCLEWRPEDFIAAGDSPNVAAWKAGLLNAVVSLREKEMMDRIRFALECAMDRVDDIDREKTERASR